MRVFVGALLVLGSTITNAFAPIQPWMVSSHSVSPNVRIMAEMPSTVTESGSTRESQVEDFKNDGLFSWMIPYLGMMGMEDGKVLSYGVLTSDPDTNQQTLSPEEAMAARQEAMQQMTNIGVEERRRRDQVGDIDCSICASFSSCFRRWKYHWTLGSLCNRRASLSGKRVQGERGNGIM
jgi:hypothetical protein